MDATILLEPNIAVATDALGPDRPHRLAWAKHRDQMGDAGARLDQGALEDGLETFSANAGHVSPPQRRTDTGPSLLVLIWIRSCLPPFNEPTSGGATRNARLGCALREAVGPRGRLFNSARRTLNWANQKTFSHDTIGAHRIRLSTTSAMPSWPDVSQVADRGSEIQSSWSPPETSAALPRKPHCSPGSSADRQVRPQARPGHRSPRASRDRSCRTDCEPVPGQV